MTYIDTLHQRGLLLEPMTNKDRLQGLINHLHPVKTHFELCRIGGNNDGGYLIPFDIDGITTCFSPGVDFTASFESDLKNRFSINSHLADYSVDGPPDGFTPISFTKKFLGHVNDEIYITLDTWVRVSGALDQDFLLQMDIEGAEYSVLLGTSEELLRKFRIITIEVHNTQWWGNLLFFSYLVEPFFQKLLKHFYIVHNHPNNNCGTVNLGGVIAPRVFELTLLRKDRATPNSYCAQFPHPLDQPNVLLKDDLPLPSNWYFSGASS